VSSGRFRLARRFQSIFYKRDGTIERYSAGRVTFVHPLVNSLDPVTTLISRQCLAVGDGASPVYTELEGRAPLPLYSKVMLRVRFAPFPGFSARCSARQLYLQLASTPVATEEHGPATRIDTDREQYRSLRPLPSRGSALAGLGWDEAIQQSERLAHTAKSPTTLFQKRTSLPRLLPPAPHLAVPDQVQVNGQRKIRANQNLALQPRHARTFACRKR